MASACPWYVDFGLKLKPCRRQSDRAATPESCLLRIRAIRQLLIEDVAGMPRSGDAREGRERLERARRRARLVVAIDWAAIVVLVIVRARTGSVLPIGPTEDSIFALGLLAIAAHSGFRLGQLEKLQAVDRALGELDARSERSPEPGEHS